MSSKTIGQVAGFVLGAALIAAGIFTGGLTTALGTSLIISGGTMIVSQAIVDLTMPKTPARQASEMTIALGEQPRVLMVGEAFTPGSLVDGFDYGGKYGTDWEVLIIRLADHKCHSLTGFYVNDEYNAYTGNGAVARYKDKLEIYFRSDTTNQAIASVVTDHGPGWTSADIGESGCDVVVAYKADKPDAKHPVWPGGRPRFGFVLKGALCYDPRLDDTVTGGSGSHRYDDPDTWEWSENAVICRYKWVRGVYANDNVAEQSDLLIGRGLTAEEAPPENIFAAANLCDDIAASVHPYAIRTGGSGILGASFSPDYARFYQEDTTVLFVWDVATQTMIAEVPLAAGAIAASNDGVYAKGGGPTASDLVLYHYDRNGGSEALLVHGFDALFGNPRYAASQLFFYPITNNESNLGYFTGTAVTELSIGFAASHVFQGPGGEAYAIGSASISGNNLYLAKVPPGVGTPSATITTSAAAGAAFGMLNAADDIVAWQAGTLYLIDGTTLTVTSSVAFSASVGFVQDAFDAVSPGSTSIWIGFTEIDTSDLSTIRTVDPDDWIGQGSLTGSVYDPINNAIMSHEFGTQEVTWRFLDRHGGYRVAGPVYANQEFLEVEEMFALACAGNVVTREGSVELEPGQAKSVVASFTDDDLLVGAEVQWNQNFLSEANSEWVNTVVARYVEPSQHWEDHAAPVLRDLDDILADGKPREASITLRLVRYQAQALRVAEIARRMGRLWGRANVKLGPRFCELEEGDWVSWQSERYFGGSTGTFRIESYSIDEKWQVSLTLRSITAGVFADDASAFWPPDLSQIPPPVVVPAIGAPEADNWALAAITLDGPGASVPALEVTGSADDDDYVSEIIVEYWLDDGVLDPVGSPDSIPWASAGRFPASTTKVDITSVVGAETYYVAVSYVVSGESGDRLVLGPVTLEGFSTTSLTLEDDATPLHLEDGAAIFFQE